jgi:predicted ATPase
MRLKSIGLSNFKAFGKKHQTIPIKPITLVFGENSAGKSSLLHSLLWFNHATRCGETDVFHPSLSGETVNLGGFEQCLNRKSGEQRLKMSLTMEDESDSVHSAERKIEASIFQLVLHFGRLLHGKEPVLERCGIYADEQLLLHGWVSKHDSLWVEAKIE